MIAHDLSLVNLVEYDPIQLRYDMDWTLLELSEMMGVSYSVTLKWSTGKRKPGSMARRLAGILKQTLEK